MGRVAAGPTARPAAGDVLGRARRVGAADANLAVVAETDVERILAHAQTRKPAILAVDSIQIVRGSDSTLGGRGSAGGTINIISKLPQAQDFATLSGSYGNADFRRIAGDVNLRAGDMAAFRVEGVYHDQDVAGRDAIYARRWGIAPSVTIGLGTPTRLTSARQPSTTAPRAVARCTA